MKTDNRQPLGRAHLGDYPVELTPDFGDHAGLQLPGCSACFSGNYPVPEEGRDQLKLFEKVSE